MSVSFLWERLFLDFEIDTDRWWLPVPYCQPYTLLIQQPIPTSRTRRGGASTWLSSKKNPHCPFGPNENKVFYLVGPILPVFEKSEDFSPFRPLGLSASRQAIWEKNRIWVSQSIHARSASVLSETRPQESKDATRQTSQFLFQIRTGLKLAEFGWLLKLVQLCSIRNRSSNLNRDEDLLPKFF